MHAVYRSAFRGRNYIHTVINFKKSNVKSQRQLTLDKSKHLSAGD